MARKVTHAPDGGAIPGPLCEEPTGDVSTFENDVDCPECLDRLEMSERTSTGSPGRSGICVRSEAAAGQIGVR